MTFALRKIDPAIIDDSELPNWSPGTVKAAWQALNKAALYIRKAQDGIDQNKDACHYDDLNYKLAYLKSVLKEAQDAFKEVISFNP